MSRIMRCRAGGSRPLVGSSRSSSRGPCAMAWASLASCFMPERIRAELAIARLAQAHVEERLVRALQRCLGGRPGQLGHVAHEAHGRHVRDEGVVLRHVADEPADLLASRMSSPRILAVPRTG